MAKDELKPRVFDEKDFISKEAREIFKQAKKKKTPKKETKK